MTLWSALWDPPYNWLPSVFARNECDIKVAHKNKAYQHDKIAIYDSIRQRLNEKLDFATFCKCIMYVIK